LFIPFIGPDDTTSPERDQREPHLSRLSSTILSKNAWHLKEASRKLYISKPSSTISPKRSRSRSRYIFHHRRQTHGSPTPTPYRPRAAGKGAGAGAGAGIFCITQARPRETLHHRPFSTVSSKRHIFPKRDTSENLHQPAMFHHIVQQMYIAQEMHLETPESAIKSPLSDTYGRIEVPQTLYIITPLLTISPKRHAWPKRRTSENLH